MGLLSLPLVGGLLLGVGLMLPLALRLGGGGAAPPLGACASAERGDTIPNTFHFVVVGDADFAPRLVDFIGIYSAYISNAGARVVVHATHPPRPGNASYYAAVLSRLPRLEFARVAAPAATRNGTPIAGNAYHAAAAFQSDFLRPAVLRAHGGVYADLDVVVLRDLSPLRRAGFRNVFGLQFCPGACVGDAQAALANGIMMAAKGSALMAELEAEAHARWPAAFGPWVLTEVAKRRHHIPHEVLVMHQDALLPFSWEPDGQRRLYGERTRARRGRTERFPVPFDDRLTYALHAFRGYPGGRGAAERIPAGERPVPWLLERAASRYAAAARPVLRAALRAGLLDADAPLQ